MEWLATTIIIVALTWLIAMIMYVRSKSPIDLAFVIVVTIIGIVWTYMWIQDLSRHSRQSRQSSNHENFVDWNNFVDLVNIDPSDPAAAASVEAYAFLQDNYNEHLTPIATGLTVYYSAFSKASFPDPSTAMWYNISPFFRTAGSTRICPDVRIEDTHIKMSLVPTYSRDEGMHIGNITLTGAACNKLGIKASASFSYFMMLSVMELPSEGEQHELAKIYAHTKDINGISVILENVGGNMTLTVTFGEQVVADNHVLTSVTLRKPMLIIVNKNLQDMTVATFANLDSADILALRTESVKQLPTSSASDIVEVEFSNKEMSVNSGKKLMLNMHAMGFYRAALSTSKQNDLSVYLAKEYAKMSKYMQQLGSTMLALQQRVIDIKSCKFDQTTCDACKSVTDWSNMSLALSQATDTCLTSIHTFCTANPEHSFCACWNTDNPAASTSKCENFVKIFSTAGSGSESTSTIGVDDIDKDTLAVIRDKYNLCPCDQVGQCSKDALAPISSPSLKDVRPFLLKIDPNQWTINMDDVEAYNNLQIENPAVGDIPKEMLLMT